MEYEYNFEIAKRSKKILNRNSVAILKDKISIE
jgi:hypothetical protein